MDMILNRSPFSEEAVGKSVNKAAGCDDDVLLVRLYHEEDLHDDNDYKFRTMILFCPHVACSTVPESAATRMWGWQGRWMPLI